VLYFTKIRIILISIFTIIFVYLTLSNFIKIENDWLDKKINLGLDLQGGSYLLLEIDNQPVITQRLQNTLSSLRKYLKNKKIYFKNLRIQNDETIIFNIENDQIEQTKILFEDQNSDINPYYPKFKSHQFDLTILNNEFRLNFSKYGLIEIKKTSLDQALEI
ncbi:uncharacterized protein METZ01_LOCUS225393, partial [marine metagenome]